MFGWNAGRQDLNSSSIPEAELLLSHIKESLIRAQLQKKNQNSLQLISPSSKCADMQQGHLSMDKVKQQERKTFPGPSWKHRNLTYPCLDPQVGSWQKRGDKAGIQPKPGAPASHKGIANQFVKDSKSWSVLQTPWPQISRVTVCSNVIIPHAKQRALRKGAQYLLS